ncbi:MAG TPA: DsbE family thiol:disulfide interchange protein [Rhizomicrobium sp.]|nr:DsbE family thiol:disulfide interchange protein [Rhizomicrobium sp.]
MKRIAVFIPLAIFAGFAVALWLGLSNDPTHIPSVLIDKPMPPFELAPVVPGQRGLSHADLKGRVSLVNVFGSWCGVCTEEHPTLMKLAANRTIAIYGIDWKDTPADGAKWLAEHGDPYIRVGNDETGRTALDLGVTGAPETFVVDRNGKVRYKQIGAITDTVWHDTLAPLVAKLEAER